MFMAILHFFDETMSRELWGRDDPGPISRGSLSYAALLVFELPCRMLRQLRAC
jgi:hypothetical protein